MAVFLSIAPLLWSSLTATSARSWFPAAAIWFATFAISSDVPPFLKALIAVIAWTMSPRSDFSTPAFVSALTALAFAFLSFLARLEALVISLPELNHVRLDALRPAISSESLGRIFLLFVRSDCLAATVFL